MKSKRIILKIGYIIVLIIFSIYVILDTFVIEKSEEVVVNTISITDQPEEYTQEENYYEDENIKIKINTITKYNTTIYIADVQISSIEYLQSAFANSTYGRNIKDTTSNIAEENNAILAINGDYYGFRNYGYVLRNGTIYRITQNSSSSQEDLVIYSDGSFGIVNESSTDLEKILKKGALQVFSFGPTLINNGEIKVNTNSEVAQSMNSNPRTAIGMIDNLHYIFVVSDGRSDESEGLSLYELAEIMKDQGCTVAYNLDGGGSSTMYFNGEIVNNPSSGMRDGERSVSDIIYIGY